MNLHLLARTSISILCVLAFMPARGQTCVSGAINANTTWYASNSPIVVCGNVTINNNVTLTIQPGTTVQFNPGVGLTVANGGRLLAEGNSNALIRFTRSGISGNWGNIAINGSDGSPETRITYANFEFNANSITVPCIDVPAGTVFLDHLTFATTTSPYIHVDAASFVISHCHFPPVTADFEPVHGNFGIKAGGHGIFLRNFFGASRNYNDVVDFTGGARPGPIVHFIENVVTGSDDDGYDLDGTDAWVEGDIFLHVHRNGTTPDSAAAVSGGEANNTVSDITIIGNLFFDCDNAATAKEGNFFTMFNNTIIHTTKTGGIDDASGAIMVRDLIPFPSTYGRGFYLEGNIIWDAEQLVRNYTASQTTVTFSNNILPVVWTGAGGNNSVTDPLLKHIPTLSETVFTNWAQAQILRDWFTPQNNSPAVGTGPNGRDKGGVIPSGVSVSGGPSGNTTQSNATFIVGLNRSGNGIIASGWPNGAGYTHYKWRLDTNAWSAETPIATPITLTNLAAGPHYVEVTGKRDSGLYQDDPLFQETAVVTRSQTWTVSNPGPRISISKNSATSVQLQFVAEANTGYTVQYRDSLSSGAWQSLGRVDPTPSVHNVLFPDSLPVGAGMRFYRVSTP